MGAFLGVAQGAATSPWLLEMRYNYKPDNSPVVLVGKGTIMYILRHTQHMEVHVHVYTCTWCACTCAVTCACVLTLELFVSVF